MATIKRNWILILGVAFLFGSFLYGIKIAFDHGWIPEEGKIALGLLLAGTALLVAYNAYKKNVKIFAEALAGLGGSLLFATFAYASFLSSLQWSTNTLFISIVTASIGLIFLGDRYKLRILSNLSIGGALFTPLIIRAGEQQVWLLFMYVLVVNCAALYLSLKNKWNETRVMAFFATLILYIVYYVLFSPTTWQKPLFYVSIIFIVYMIGVIVASMLLEDDFKGLDVYIGLVNAANFVFWSIFILGSFSFMRAVPLIIAGFSLLIVATSIFFLNKKRPFPALVYFIGALLLLAFSSNDLSRMFETPGLHYAINAGIWLILIASLYLISVMFRESSLLYLSVVFFIIALLYWYTFAWDVEWVNWFGVKYIPFINPGALVWIGMASFSFIVALSAPRVLQDEAGQILSAPAKFWETGFSLVGHIVIAGLLTIQILNAWNAYELTMLPKDIVVSTTWMIYAVTLFLWGLFSKGLIFRIFGSVVVVATSVKVIFYDLINQPTISKAISMFIIGLIILGIAWINQTWYKRQDPDAEKGP